MLIYLIGMMASGKTTIGKELANKLSYEFVDVDELIELTYKKKVKDIILEDGIDYFRQLEYDLLRNIDLDINTVVATGGGVVLNHDNVLYMKNNGAIIYLKVSLDILEERLHNDSENRPLLKKQSINTIYEERKELYENAGMISIFCDDLTIDEICINIVEQLTIT